jgi:hypothetical protein
VKTQIINLEPHDDLASVLDKLHWAKAEQLILVWPGRKRVLTQQLELRLIQRTAERRGARIGIVSLDPDVQSHAAALGIPVFEELESLHVEDWPEKTLKELPTDVQLREHSDLHEMQSMLRSRPASSLSLSLRIAVFAFTLLVILLMAIALLPSAEITVDPIPSQEQRILSLPISLSPEQTDQSAVRIDRVRVDGSIRLPTSGTSSEPGDFARGVAVFTNLGDESVTIPAGTTIRTPGSEQLYFITQTRVVLPAEIDSARSVEIIASLPGARGNIAAERITAVDGQLGLVVSVQNPEATSGGSLISRNAVSVSDLNNAREQLRSQLLTQAEQLMQANQLPTEKTLLESLSIEQVLLEEFDRETGQTADTIGLTTNVVVSGYIVDLEELMRLIEENLGISSDEEKIVPGTLEIQSIQGFENPSSDSMELEVITRFEQYSPVDRSAIAQEINGVKPLYAQRRLADDYAHNNFIINHHPEWFPWLPFFQPQINVIYSWETNP